MSAAPPRGGLTQALGAMSILESVDAERLTRPLWEVGSARGVLRTDLRAELSDPTFIETDALRTFGGEEDWWFYREKHGASIVICLRVPYQDAAIYVSDLSGAVIARASSILHSWTVELYDVPVMYK